MIAYSLYKRDSVGCITLEEISSAPSGSNYVDVINDGTYGISCQRSIFLSICIASIHSTIISHHPH